MFSYSIQTDIPWTECSSSHCFLFFCLNRIRSKQQHTRNNFVGLLDNIMPPSGPNKQDCTLDYKAFIYLEYLLLLGKKHSLILERGEGILLVTAYIGRPLLEGVPFSCFRYIESC